MLVMEVHQEDYLAGAKHLRRAPNLSFHVSSNIGSMFYMCVEGIYYVNLNIEKQPWFP